MYTHPRTIITCMLEGSSFGFTEDGVIIRVFQLDSAYYGKSLRSRAGLYLNIFDIILYLMIIQFGGSSYT